MIEQFLTTSGQVYVLDNALLSAIELRVLKADGELRLDSAIILAVNAEDGTIDAQSDHGLVRNVPRVRFGEKSPRVTWQWPGAEEPEAETAAEIEPDPTRTA